MRNTRRKMTGGATAMAGFLALASGAYACTVYKGSMTFTNTSGSQTVIGVPSGMDWCGGTPPANLTSPPNSSQQISVSSGSGTCNGTATVLGNGSYDVGYAAGKMSQGGRPHINCHSSANTKIGTYAVSGGGGAGTGGPYTYTSNVGGNSPGKGYDNVCVYLITPTDPAYTSPDANDINIKVV